MDAFWKAKNAKFFFFHADNRFLSDCALAQADLIFVGRTCQKVRFLSFGSYTPEVIESKEMIGRTFIQVRIRHVMRNAIFIRDGGRVEYGMGTLKIPVRQKRSRSIFF